MPSAPGLEMLRAIAESLPQFATAFTIGAIALLALSVAALIAAVGYCRKGERKQ